MQGLAAVTWSASDSQVGEATRTSAQGRGGWGIEEGGVTCDMPLLMRDEWTQPVLIRLAAPLAE